MTPSLLMLWPILYEISYKISTALQDYRCEESDSSPTLGNRFCKLSRENLKSQPPNPKQYQTLKYQCSKHFKALNFDIGIYLGLGFWYLEFSW
jgi:hypothetical protein